MDGVTWRVIGVLGWHRTERLAMRPVNHRRPLLRVEGSATTLRWHSARVAEMRVGGVRGHKGLRLRGDGGKDAFLLETLAVGAAAILRSFEAGTTDLSSSVFRTGQRRAMTRANYFAPPTISTSDRSPLPRSRLIETHVLRRSSAVGILGVSLIHGARRREWVEVLVMLWL